MDKIMKIIGCLALFFLFSTQIIKAENSHSKLAYLEQLAEKKTLFVADSFDISTTYLALGMVTLLIKDSCEEKQIQGYEWLDQIAALTEAKIKNEIITADDKEVELILQLLGHHKYFIDVPVSDSEKIVHYVKEGKFSYILKRGHDRGIYKYVVLAVISSFGFYFFYRRKKKNFE